MREYRGDTLFRKLRTRIGEMPEGAPFPSVRQLMEEYQVSQFTVAPALRKLRELGLLESFVGRGTFVSRRRASGRSKVLYLTNEWPGLSIVAMIGKAAHAAEARGFDFELSTYSYTENVFQRLDQVQADGVVIDALPNDFLTADQIQLLHRASVPVVICRSAVRVENISYVTGNNAAAGILAANTLYQSGHRRFGLLFSEPHIFSTSELADSFSLCGRSNRCRVTVYDCAVQTGQNPISATREYLKANYRRIMDEVSALFVISGETAAAAAETLSALGVRVPEELSLIGFGLIPDAQSGFLTTVRHSGTRMAGETMGILQNRFERKSGQPTQIEVEPALYERQSIQILTPTLMEAR